MGRAISGWTISIEKYLWEGADQGKIIPCLQELKLAGDFVAEALVDNIRSSARVMLASVMARRALWLKPRVADTASKANWCKIPCGSNLFGSKWAISKVTGGKSGLIPFDRRLKPQKGLSYRHTLLGRYREANTYRPGREFKRNWRNTQSSFFRMQKSMTTPTGEQQKSF